MQKNSKVSTGPDNEAGAVVSCLHCGNRIPPKLRPRGFCCDGCERVYQVIRDEGLGDFYAQDSGRAPVGDRPLREADFDWAKALQARVESTEGNEVEVDLSLAGMSCGGCVWLVERLGRRREGILDVRASLFAQGMTLRWRRGRFDLPGFLAELHRFGYVARRPAGRGWRWDAATGRAALCLLFAANLALLTAVQQVVQPEWKSSMLWELLTLLFILLTGLVGAGYFVQGAAREIAARRVPTDLPLLVGLGGWCVVGVGALFGLPATPWGATGFAVAVAAALLTRKAQLTLLRPLAGRAEGATSETFLGPGWMALVFAAGVIWLGLRAEGGFAAIEAVAAGGLVFVLFPLAAGHELGVSRLWIWVAVLLSFSGFVFVSTGLLNLPGALIWHGLAGILPCFGMAKGGAGPDIGG